LTDHQLESDKAGKLESHEVWKLKRLLAFWPPSIQAFQLSASWQENPLHHYRRYGRVNSPRKSVCIIFFIFATDNF
jgi:hypothetical protein